MATSALNVPFALGSSFPVRTAATQPCTAALSACWSSAMILMSSQSASGLHHRAPHTPISKIRGNITWPGAVTRLSSFGAMIPTWTVGLGGFRPCCLPQREATTGTNSPLPFHGFPLNHALTKYSTRWQPLSRQLKLLLTDWLQFLFLSMGLSSNLRKR